MFFPGTVEELHSHGEDEKRYGNLNKIHGFSLISCSAHISAEILTFLGHRSAQC